MYRADFCQLKCQLLACRANAIHQGAAATMSSLAAQLSHSHSLSTYSAVSCTITANPSPARLIRCGRLLARIGLLTHSSHVSAPPIATVVRSYVPYFIRPL
jgi:hypothetical protein